MSDIETTSTKRIEKAWRRFQRDVNGDSPTVEAAVYVLEAAATYAKSCGVSPDACIEVLREFFEDHPTE